MEQLSRDYERVEQALAFLEANFLGQPSLRDVARSAGVSEYHFQRIFGRWVGISPKRFLQFLTKEYAKKLLEDSEDVLDVAYSAGLSGSSRLHDLFVSCEAMTPGQYRQKGDGLTIRYGVHPSPFGSCMLAVTDRGICGLHFVENADRRDHARWLERAWPKAVVENDQEGTAPLARQVFPFSADNEPAPLHVFIRGTNFQIKVWEALLKIPLGRVVSYEDVARHLGVPAASRAVGNAVGANPIPFLIPCHRVIRKAGELGNYGEGPLRKKAILGWEAAQHERLPV